MVLFALVFNRKGSLNRDGRALVQIRAYQAGRARYFSTGIYLEPRHWARRVAKVVDCPNAPELNAELRRQLHELENYTLRIQQRHGSCALEQLDSFFQAETFQTFNQFARAELEQAAISPNTRKTRKNTLHLLDSFCPAVAFHSLNYDFVCRLDAFLRARGLGVNTIAKHHQILRTAAMVAIKKELLETNPYAHFRIKQQPTARVAITQAELERIEQLEADGTDAEVRDMFLLGCYTGLRFSDLSQLTAAGMRTGADGIELHLRAQKTKKMLMLPLELLHSGKPADLVRYYAASARDRLFSKITNQGANRVLKRIAKAAKIKKTLTMHVARHTFATLLVNRVPVAVLQQLLQHSDLKTTMRYVHESASMIKNELRKVVW